jgi:hypothetical protein
MSALLATPGRPPGPADPVRSLQAAARRALAHVAPGSAPSRVAVWDASGKRVIDLVVPAATDADDTLADRPAIVPGWCVTEAGAFYDGAAVAVAPSRLKLLAALVRADGPVRGRELARLGFDAETDEDNVRYHVARLKKELAQAFPEFEGEIVSAGEGGYRLRLR